MSTRDSPPMAWASHGATTLSVRSRRYPNRTPARKVDTMPRREVAVGLTLFAGAVGWLFGYINERLVGGSILPSWGLRALSNLLAGCWAEFVW